MVLMGPWDKLLVENPGLELCLFDDDLTLHATGPNSDRVTFDLLLATQRCIELLEGDLKLVISRGGITSKTVAIASSGSLGKIFRSPRQPSLAAVAV